MKFVAALAVLAVAAVVAVAGDKQIRTGPPGELPHVDTIRNQAQPDEDANMVTYSGSTRFRPRYFRPNFEDEGEGACSQQDVDIEDAEKARWSATGFEVSQSGEYSILSAQRFDGGIFVYESVFIPSNSYDTESGNSDSMCLDGNDEDSDYPFANGINYSALNNIHLERGTRYILVTTGKTDSDRGKFQNYIWGPAGSEIMIEAVGCAQVGCDDDSFTDTCGCDDECEALCDCCFDYCDECAQSITDSYFTDTCGNVKGDPHYFGFRGDVFDVQGEVGKIYNILTDADVAVNAAYDFGCKPETTVLSQIGIVYGEHELKFDLQGTHQLNGDAIAEGMKVFLNDAKTAWAERHTESGLRVVTPEYTMSAHSVASKCGLSHIDVTIQARNPNSAPHGLLGQTVNEFRERSVADETNSAEQGAGSIQGVVAEYEVSHLFAVDHVYSRFGKVERPAPVASKRM